MFKLKYYLTIALLGSALFLFIGCAPQTTQPGSAAESGEASDDHHDEDGDSHGDEDHHDEEKDSHGDEDHHGEEKDSHGDEDHHGEEGDAHGDEDHHDEEHREHGAHEHGAAELTVALIDGQAEISLETPAFNLVGFEYAPKTDEEKAAVEAATETLEKGEWFALTASAGCTMDSADVDSTMGESDHHEEGEEHHDEEGEEHHDEDGEEETHSSFFVSYKLNCTSLEDLASLDATMLFSSFPNFKSVDAQWLNDTQQSAATLDKDQPILSFE